MLVFVAVVVVVVVFVGLVAETGNRTLFKAV